MKPNPGGSQIPAKVDHIEIDPLPQNCSNVMERAKGKVFGYEDWRMMD